MFSEKKAQKRLSLLVTLALSTGGACLTMGVDSPWGESVAHAADVTVGVSDDRPGDVIGGTTDNNTVTIGAEGGGDHPVIGGNVAGGTSANASGNTVTINSIHATAAGNGTIFGGRATGTASNNTVIFKGGSATSLIGGATTGASGGAQGNTVTVSGGNLSYVWGGLTRTAGTGSATGNTVNINGGTFSSGGVIIGGGGMNGVTGNMSGNTVTITSGALNNNNKIYAGDSRNLSSTSNGNIVNLGDKETGNFSANLNRAEIWGTSYGEQVQDNDSDRIKGNTLNVNASGIRLEKVRNFEKINFNLTPTVTAGSTMLTMDTGNFGLGYGKAFDWKNFSLTGKENDTDKTKYGRIGNINLLHAYSGSDMKIGNYTTGGKKGTTGDYEYHMESNGHTFFGEHIASLIKASVDRFQNADATYNGTAFTGNELYGGYSSLGNTTNNNKLTIKALPSGGLGAAYGAETAGTAGNSTNNTLTVESTGTTGIGLAYGGAITNDQNAGEVSDNKVIVENGGMQKVYAGYTLGGGAVKKNITTIRGGEFEAVEGGYVDYNANNADVTENEVHFHGGKADVVRAGFTNGTGAARKNKTFFHGGEAKVVEGALASGESSENEVTITGGKITQAVYGSLTNAGGNQNNNIVNFGDDTHHDLSAADLTNANIYGGDATSGPVSGNTLNVQAKNVAVKSVNNFDKYNFKLNNSLASGDTMLTLRNGGFGREIDWNNNFGVDTTGLTGRPNGTITLIRSEDVNALTFKDGYAPRDLGSTENTEYFMGTDTGTRTATSVIMNYNIFRNNEWTYDGTNPATATEVAGGISYRDGNTTYNNKITVTGVPSTNLNFVYGGKTNGAADSKENQVTIESTGAGSIANINGGYTGKTDGVASKNRVFIKGGTVTNAMGGAVSGANGSATGNEVTVEGGEVANVIGGGGTPAAAGDMSENTVTITGGTVTGQIVGGDSRVTTSTSNNNTVTLGGGTLTGSEVWGTSYNGTVYANDDEKIKGNTLNVQAAGLTVKKIRNFEKLNFKMTDALQNGATMLELSEPGGFGQLSSDTTDVRVKWTNVTTNVPENLDTLQGKNKITLLKALASGKLKFSEYALDPKIQGNYETVTHLDANATVNPDKTADATSVELSLNRFKNGNRTLNAASTFDNNEFYAGISAYGAGTEYNHLEIDAIPAAAGLDAAYGGKTEGTSGISNTHGGSHHNELVVKGGAPIQIPVIAAGYISNADNTADAADNTTTLTETDAANTFTGKVFGGKTVGAGNALRNMVNVLRNVTGDIVGGYAAKGAASYNTVNLGAVEVHGNVYGGQIGVDGSGAPLSADAQT